MLGQCRHSLTDLFPDAPVCSPGSDSILDFLALYNFISYLSYLLLTQAIRTIKREFCLEQYSCCHVALRLDFVVLLLGGMAKKG